uniref:Uncharacterized protein n=1 Tax=Physcomitrium patens TaxID=3218 RepID=A0A2K1ID91_PHYPA|nr:hypothetical protein PHYPA_029396 [Physcomitrium patens]
MGFMYVCMVFSAHLPALGLRCNVRDSFLLRRVVYLMFTGPRCLFSLILFSFCQ